MAIVSRVLPFSNKTAITGIPKAAIQSITMAIRVGTKQFAIGYVNEFGWEANRDVKSIHQIEPYPDGTFDSSKVLGNTAFGTTGYWPGEPVEIIPGKIDIITITLSRYVLYSSNLLAACMRIENAGTETSDVALPATNDIVNDITNINTYMSLIQQVRPIEITQMFISPTTGSVVFGRKFEECWFTKISETIPKGESNEAILENGELKCARVRPYAAVVPDAPVDKSNV